MPSRLKKWLSPLRGLRRIGPIIIPLLILAVFLAGWWLGHPAEEKKVAQQTSANSSEIWTCSMHPTVRQPDPGLCPICEMDLIPVAAGGSSGLRELALSNDAVARLDVRVAPVVRRPFEKSLELFGRVTPNETTVSTTTARMNGRLEKLFVDFTGATVLKGQPIAEIYSPDLYVAQEELINARRGLSRNQDSTRQALYRAAREKLRLLEISPEQIDAIAQQEKPSDTLTITAPQDGVVTHLDKREGDYVQTGDPLFRLAELSRLWVQLEAYEEDLPWLALDQEVTFRTQSLPGETFEGRISFIDPVLDEARRITRVRVAVANPRRVLKPGMFATATVQARPPSMQEGEREPAHPLLVPASAVLRTGDRAVVYRRPPSEEGVRFEGREIILGPRGDEYFIVHSGIEEGDLVVTRGAFQLDSELQIQAKPAMMLQGQAIGEGPAQEAPETISGAWKPILRSLARARESRDDAEAFRNHLQRADAILATIEPDFLSADYRPLWTEAKMQLGNLFTESALLAHSKTVETAWENLVRELPDDAALAGLPWQLPELESAPPARIARLQNAIAAYLPVSNALAYDQPQEALEAVPELVTSLRKLDADLTSVTAQLNQASDESSLRAALKPTTNALRDLIADGAHDRLGSLYLVHCPMADDNEGANWLSRIPKVENPYYGSSMFDCGDVTETLSLPLDEPAPTEPE